MDKHPIKILVVDDNRLNQMMIRLFLQNNQVLMEEAYSGKEAIGKLEGSTGFDLVLMDIQMPEMDGLEATSYIRENLKMDIPIIAISGSDAPEDRQIYLRTGMNDCLCKPLDEESLLIMIHHHLRK